MENFNSVLYLANLLYGLDMNLDDAIEVALIAWNKIGNKQHKLYRLRTQIDNTTLSVELPCNCDEIEAVTYDFEDWQYTTNDTVHGDYNSLFVEHYIEGLKAFKNPYYTSGKFVKYTRAGDTLYFDQPGNINLLYKGIIVDEEGLPYLSSKETEAIACYLAYVQKFKEGIATHNQAVLAEAQMLEQRWYKLCDAARVPTYVNLNDMNRILDAKANWNRKLFGKSFKPLK